MRWNRIRQDYRQTPTWHVESLWRTAGQSASANERIVFCEQLLQACFVETNAYARGFLLIANNFRQAERARDEKQDADAEKQSLPGVQRKEKDPAERAKEARSESNDRLHEERRGGLRHAIGNTHVNQHAGERTAYFHLISRPS